MLILHRILYFEMAISKEFRQALLSLSEREKDKLLVRLIRKDKILMARLEFELLGNESSQEKRDALEESLQRSLRSVSAGRFNLANLLLSMRSGSGEITKLVKITKDKVGEVVLNLALLNTALELYGKRIETSSGLKAGKLRIYIVARAFRTMVLMQKIHEDLHADFREDLEKLGMQIASHHLLMRTAIRHGLDVNWLTGGDIPSDIAEQQTRLRGMGFLK
jgi:hypothetical protein